MTGALLSAALAVLLWPDRRTERARRASRLGPAREGTRRTLRRDQVPVPALAAAGAVAVGAAVSTPLVALLAGICALIGVRAWETAGRERAQDGRLAALAAGLGALTADLRSGRPLDAATAASVDACGDEDTGRALARAVRTGPGRSSGTGSSAGDDETAAALDRLAAAVVLSTRTGCSLADVVAAVDDDLRARLAHRRELRGAVAAPRASAMLLAALPLVGLAMGSGIGADPWRVLTATGAGQVLLVVGVAFELAGLVWSRRLILRALR